MMVAQSEASMNKIDKRLKKDTEVKERTEEGKKKRGRGRPKKQPEPLSEEERKELAAKREQEEQKYDNALTLYKFFKQAWGSEDNPLSYKAREDIRATEEEALDLMDELITEVQSCDELSDDIKRILKRLSKYRDYLFTYLAHPGIPPDNNPVERALRHFVIMRKISHNFRSSEVIDSFTLYLSFYQTCKKNGVEFGKALKSMLLGKTESVLQAIGLV
ncbi:MAG: IS66 family transposase [Promethearchaeia archaeon]